MSDTTKKLRHGGDIDAATERFGHPSGGWLDLSTGINPVPYPVSEIEQHIWQRLPTASDEAALIDAARGYYRVPEHAGILAAPGTQAIIQWLPTVPETCRVQVIGPTYEEHAASWRAHNHTVEIIDDIDIADADVVIVVNPNNPNGRVIEPDALLHTARRLSGRGTLIVDEAFADVRPDISVTSETGTGTEGLLILRSFGKFFGLAGLRLGFAIGSETAIGKLKRLLGPWAVTGPALQIGTRALRDLAWHEQTRTRLANDALRLDAILTKAGMDFVGGTLLYRLFRSDDAPSIYEALGSAGIMVRKFDCDPTWLRFGLPGRETDWARLETALRTRR
ncbi:MAG: threonine-phosphate decarboxylase [Rhodospirillales bacterium]|nr:threonine-phosphate decarboxylase [Rhodospirillales bacterium]